MFCLCAPLGASSRGGRPFYSCLKLFPKNVAFSNKCARKWIIMSSVLESQTRYWPCLTFLVWERKREEGNSSIYSLYCGTQPEAITLRTPRENSKSGPQPLPTLKRVLFSPFSVLAIASESFPEGHEAGSLGHCLWGHVMQAELSPSLPGHLCVPDRLKL